MERGEKVKKEPCTSSRKGTKLLGHAGVGGEGVGEGGEGAFCTSSKKGCTKLVGHGGGTVMIHL